MPIESTYAMREFMSLINAYTAKTPEANSGGEPAAETAAGPHSLSADDVIVPPAHEHAALLAESRDLIFKLRAHNETGINEERALGIEQGFSRAADMIENLLRRYEKG